MTSQSITPRASFSKGCFPDRLVSLVFSVISNESPVPYPPPIIDQLSLRVGYGHFTYIDILWHLILRMIRGSPLPTPLIIQKKKLKLRKMKGFASSHLAGK